MVSGLEVTSDSRFAAAILYSESEIEFNSLVASPGFVGSYFGVFKSSTVSPLV